MKLKQIFDRAADQNEIESKYLWYRPTNQLPGNMYRINLSTLAIDLSQTISDLIYIKHCQPLPNNKTFSVSIDSLVLELEPQYLFIADENFKIKAIESPHKDDIYATNSVNIASCFYDDSVFIFESDWDAIQADGKCLHSFWRYFILQNKWVKLNKFPFSFPTSFIGFNQKILIVGDTVGIWAYDIVLDSYSRFCIDEFDEDPPKMLMKNDGKIYLISLSKPYWIYSCDGNLSDWTFLFKSDIPLFNQFKYQVGLDIDNYLYYVFYEGSIYFISESYLYRFDLKELQLRKTKGIKQN